MAVTVRSPASALAGTRRAPGSSNRRRCPGAFCHSSSILDGRMCVINLRYSHQRPCPSLIALIPLAGDQCTIRVVASANPSLTRAHWAWVRVWGALALFSSFFPLPVLLCPWPSRLVASPADPAASLRKFDEQGQRPRRGGDWGMRGAARGGSQRGRVWSGLPPPGKLSGLVLRWNERVWLHQAGRRQRRCLSAT